MIHTIHLFPVLDQQLIELLHSLTPGEWNQPTIASKWSVKDVAAHLLDGNIRTLSISRDRYQGDPPGPIYNNEQLIDYLNSVNATWVKSMQRVSPAVLIGLLESTGKAFCKHMASLPLHEKAVFAVSWAGESVSANWFHIAREYTEKFHHQQQIRDAVGKTGIITNELYKPFLETIMMALPYTYRDQQPKNQSLVKITITGTGGGDWFLLYEGSSWKLVDQPVMDATAHTIIDGNIAWKLFTKSWRKRQVLDHVIIEGDKILGEKVLEMVAVMA